MHRIRRRLHLCQRAGTVSGVPLVLLRSAADPPPFGGSNAAVPPPGAESRLQRRRLFTGRAPPPPGRVLSVSVFSRLDAAATRFLLRFSPMSAGLPRRNTVCDSAPGHCVSGAAALGANHAMVTSRADPALLSWRQGRPALGANHAMLAGRADPALLSWRQGRPGH